MPHHALIVDDEPSICWALKRALEGESFKTAVASTAEEGLELAKQTSFAIVLLDVRLPGIDGLSALPQFQATTNNAPIIVMTAFGDLDTAVSAVRLGASDYLTKPFKLEDILQTCHRAVKSASKSMPKRDSTTDAEDFIVGKSAAMQQVFKQIAVVADSDLPVLITGETGTGKELVAQAIARHSSERSTPYLVVSPAALNPDSLESQLFGANQGIFNQSDSNHVGYFERADGGTLLLDEIGDLPLFLQVKLLRVLEQQSFSRVGDLEARKASVRILASTNRDLRQAVLKGEFREDLYHRLSGMLIHLPTLSERKDDIPLLCSHFLSRVSAHIPVDPSISDELMDELKERPWHGNARELRNATEHAAIVARGRKLTIEDFPPSQPGRSSERPSIEKSISDAVETWTREKLEDRSIHGSLQPEFLAAFESELFKQILKHTDGNRAQAAQWLGLHRATLRDRLRSYGIE